MDSTKRLISLDTLRGLAIFIMLLCNSAPYYMSGKFSFLFRAFISSAAPLFFAVSGYILAYNYKKNPKNFTYRVLRQGLLLLLLAVLNDIFIFGIAPFLSFDILYPISFAILLSPLFVRLPKNLLFVLSLAIMLFPLYLFSNYHDNVYVINLLDFNQNIWNFNQGRTLFVLGEINEFSFVRMLQSWFVDGWYPIFPWMGIYLISFCAGLYINRIRKSEFFENSYQAVLSLVILIAGLIYISQTPRIERSGYPELFYPPDYMFIVTVSMFLYFIVCIPENVLGHKIFFPFIILGRSSLTLYIIHNIFIIYILPHIYQFVNQNFFITFAIFFLIILCIACLLYIIKKTPFWKKAPFVVRFLLGS